MIWSLALLAAALLVAWGWYSSGLLLSISRAPVDAIPASFGLPYEDVAFTSSDGVALAGWFIPAPSPSDVTLVVCHGWGANRSDVLPHTAFLRRGGYNLLYFDFRNHGESGGRRSSLLPMEIRDLEAAIRFLQEKRPEQARRIGLFGLSMGGAVSIVTAARRPEIGAVVAESPFTSFYGVVVRFAKLFYGVPRYPLVPVTLLFVRLRLGMNPEQDSPIRHVHRISPRPLFLIQGGRDVRMPSSEGEALFARAGEPKALWTVPGADHGESAEIAGKEYEDRILAFYQKAFPGRAS